MANILFVFDFAGPVSAEQAVFGEGNASGLFHLQRDRLSPDKSSIDSSATFNEPGRFAAVVFTG